MVVSRRCSSRVAAACIAFALIVATSPRPRAEAVPPIDKRITYILPQWLEFLSATDVPQQAARLRTTR
ncbi:MAG TPA: hypothetical protein VEL51_11000 [Vicinamibacterales bacterium]|nr:hypothetical protein [Vicinamibacterales bacterium]